MKILDIETINDVYENVNEGVYDVRDSKPRPILRKDTILSEDETVRWNREKVEEINKENKEYNEAIKELEKTGGRKFEEDLVLAITKVYNLNTEHAKEVYKASYEEGHSSGYSNIISYVYDFAEFAENILKVTTNN